MSFRLQTRAAILLVCLSLLLAGCRVGSNTNSPTATSEVGPTAQASATLSPTPEPETGGSLVVALPREPDTLNFSLTEIPAALWVISTLDARMIRVRSDGSYEAQLLREVPTTGNGGISADGRVYTLHFRKDLKWSDGEPLDGRDFRFTWQTITNPAYPAVSRAGWDAISDVELSSDNLTVTLHLRQSSADFIETTLAGAASRDGGLLLPAHVLKDVPVQQIREQPYGGDKHVGSGPFKIVRWTEEDSLVVERNSHFSGSEPLLDRIVFRFVTDPRQAISYLTTGEVDLAVELPETSLPDLAQAADTNLLVTPKAGAVEMLAFNLNDPENLNEPNPLFADPTVRRAITLAFNRENIVKTLLLGQTSVARSPLDHSRWDVTQLTPIPYNPQQAANLLDQAGWTVQSGGIRAKDGVRLSFTITTVLGDDPVAVLRRQIQDAFITDMKAVGIDVHARNYTEAEIESPNGILANRNFDTIDLDNNERGDINKLASWVSSDAIPSPQQPMGRNVMGYRNAKVDELLAKQATEMDPAARQQLITQILQQLQQDLPVIPIYDHLEIDVSRHYVQALEPGPISGLWWNTEDWWVNRKSASP